MSFFAHSKRINSSLFNTISKGYIVNSNYKILGENKEAGRLKLPNEIKSKSLDFINMLAIGIIAGIVSGYFFILVAKDVDVKSFSFVILLILFIVFIVIIWFISHMWLSKGS
jgi:hypothetical protein